MSEETTNYGTPKTVCDTESYPPQTGDLLGAYLAKLSARVRQCEGYNAYMATLTERVAKLESMFKDMDENENDLFAQMNELEAESNVQGRALERGHKAWKKCKERLTALEAKQAELEAVIKSRVVAFEGAAAQAAKPDFWERLSASDRTTVRAEEKRIADSMNVPPVCATCGHDMDSHRRDGLRNGHKRKRWCDGGTLGKPCKCREFKPVA